jgi:branched-chain amino acid transport system ATP-binding protein
MSTDAPVPRTSILTVDGLSMRFGGLTAVDSLSFEARRGAITALIGPNGAGKTTVFNCITGFYKPTSGSVSMRLADGSSHALQKLDNHQIPSRAKVARTFQNIRLFSGMTCLENLLVAQHNALMRASGFTVAGLLGLPSYARAEKAAVETARRWLELTGLVHRADDAAGDLSYGDQRRLEIARALCTAPEMLCLDEPAAGLNPRESDALNILLKRIRDEARVSLLLIEHDMGVVMGVSDHIIVLDHGAKIAEGTPDDVRANPAVIAAYLGTDDDDQLADAAAVRKRDMSTPRPGSDSRPLLDITGIETFYGKIQALKGVDLRVAEGEIVTLIGANGAGKTTLMMTICGNPRARTGTVRFAGHDITRMPTHELVRLGLAHAPEGRRIFPRMTVLENLQMGAILNPEGQGAFDQDLAEVTQLFPILGSRGSQRAGTLSGGEQQMLAIGRALMGRPKLLLLDEPSLGLAPLIVRQIFAVLADLNQRGLTILLVEQNAHAALRLAHRGYVMVNGVITLAGTGRELLARPEVQAAYLEGKG